MLWHEQAMWIRSAAGAHFRSDADPPGGKPWRLVVTFAPALAVAAVILLRASLTPDGYLSADSRFYLAAASNLAHGLGWRLANDGSAPAGLEPFADWPVGYPTLIWLFAKFTSLSPFAAAKGLSVLLVLSCAGVIARTFGRDAPLCAVPLSFASTLEICSYTWSEVPFIALMIAAAALLAAAWSDVRRHSVGRALLLWTCCTGMFLCRYVGVFALTLPALAAVPALWRANWRAALPYLLALVAASVVIAAYLEHNLELTGYLTGMGRNPPTDTPWARFAMLARAVRGQLVVDVAQVRLTDWRAWAAGAIEMLALLAVVGNVRRRYSRPLRQLRLDPEAGAFITVGLLYLGAIIVLRWRNQFDPYNFRLLGPGSLLVTIGLMRLALTSWPAAQGAIAIAAASLAIAALAFAVAALPRPWQPRYAHEVRAVAQRYASLPPGAIVIFGSSHLRYLRPDLYVAVPLCPPWFVEHESWAAFIGRLDHGHPIYLDLRQPLSALAACDASIRTAVASYPAGRVVPLVSRAG